MKQKMKKCLCLMLSFVFIISSNCQLLAQDITAKKPATYNPPVKQGTIEYMQKELKNLRTQFEYIKNTVNRIFGAAKHAEVPDYLVIEYEDLVARFERPYGDFIVDVNAYDAFVAEKSQATSMEILAEKYTNRAKDASNYLGANPVRRGFGLSEGAVFQKMRNNIKYVLSFGPQGVNNRTTGIVSEIPGIQQVQEQVEASLGYVEERLNLAENQLNRITEGNEQIIARLRERVEKSGTTVDDVVEYAMKTIPEEDLQFLGLVKKTERAKVSKFKMAKGLRDYLRATGKKTAKTRLLKLMKHVSPTELHGIAYKKGYENLLLDFPVLPKQGYDKIAKLGRRALRVTPIAVFGIFLTAGIITDVKASTCLANTLGPSEIQEIVKHIDNGTSSVWEDIAYYNSGWSDENVKKDVYHYVNAMNLSLAVKETYDNFEDIDAMFVEAEKDLNLAFTEVDAEVENQFNEHMATASDKIAQYENMI